MADGASALAVSPGEASRLRLAKWIGYFAFADLLLFPYFQLLIIPFSLPILLAAYFVVGVTVKKDFYLQLFILLALLIVGSAAASLFFYGRAELVLDNLKRALQFLTTFLYFFYFRWLAARVDFKLGPVLSIFLVWFSYLVLRFMNDPFGTMGLMSSLYGRLVTSVDAVEETLRFGYFFTDPNTAVYFFLLAVAPLLMMARSLPVFILVVAAVTFVTLASQSRGGLIAAGLMVWFSVYPLKVPTRPVLSRRQLWLTLGIAVLAVFAVNFLIWFAQENIIISYAFERLFSDSSAYQTGGGRTHHWRRVTSLLPLPIGRGYNMLVEGMPVTPHSDVLRMIYSYGTAALVTVMAFFFSRLRSLIPMMIPALMAFLINSLIDEQKLMGLFLSLLAVYVGRGERGRAGGPL